MSDCLFVRTCTYDVSGEIEYMYLYVLPTLVLQGQAKPMSTPRLNFFFFNNNLNRTCVTENEMAVGRRVAWLVDQWRFRGASLVLVSKK